MPAIRKEGEAGAIRKEGKQAEGVLPSIPNLESLLSVSTPIDAPHRFWSPIQKLTQLYQEYLLANTFPLRERVSKKISEQGQKLIRIYSQMRNEQLDGNKPSMQVWALFAELCELIAKNSSEEQKGQLYVLAESAISIATGGDAALHAPLRLYGAEIALQAAIYGRSEHVTLVVADPSNEVARRELALLEKQRVEGEKIDQIQLARLQGVVGLTPAQRKFPSQESGPTGGRIRAGDVYTGYLSVAASQLRGALELTKQSERGDTTVLPLDKSQQNRAEELKAEIFRSKAAMLTPQQFTEAVNDLFLSGSTPEKVGLVVAKMDSSTLKDISIFDLGGLVDKLSKRLIAKPIVEELLSEIITRIITILQTDSEKLSLDEREYKENGREHLRSILEDSMSDLSPTVAVRNYLAVAKYELGLSAVKHTSKRPSPFARLFLGRTKTPHESSHLDEVKKCLDSAIQRAGELRDRKSEQLDEWINAENVIVATYLEFIERKLTGETGNDIQVLEAASSQLVASHFSPNSLEIISRKLATLQDQSKHTVEAGPSDVVRQAEQEIIRLKAVIEDKSTPKLLKSKARLDLADQYIFLDYSPDIIVKLLYCEEFNLRAFSQDITALQRETNEEGPGTNNGGELPHNRTPLENQLFKLRRVLAQSMLAVLHDEYASKRALDVTEKGKVVDWVEEAISLHPQIVRETTELSQLLLQTPAQS